MKSGYEGLNNILIYAIQPAAIFQDLVIKEAIADAQRLF